MARRAGSADLPLHNGRVPVWLGQRMARLGAVIAEARAVTDGMVLDAAYALAAVSEARQSSLPWRRVQRDGSLSSPAWSRGHCARVPISGPLPHFGQQRTRTTLWRTQTTLQPSCQRNSHAPCSRRQCGQQRDAQISTSCAWAARASATGAIAGARANARPLKRESSIASSLSVEIPLVPAAR